MPHRLADMVRLELFGRFASKARAQGIQRIFALVCACVCVCVCVCVREREIEIEREREKVCVCVFVCV